MTLNKRWLKNKPHNLSNLRSILLPPHIIHPRVLVCPLFRDHLRLSTPSSKCSRPFIGDSPTLSHVYLFNYLILMVFSYLFNAFYHLVGNFFFHLGPHFAIRVSFICLFINKNFGRIDSRP